MNAAATPLTDTTRLRPLAAALALGLLVAVVTYYSLRLTRIGGGVASIWVTNGLVTGILLVAARRNWPALLVAAVAGQLFARLGVGDPVLLTVGVLAVNTLESMMVVGWVRRREPDLRTAAALGPVARASVGSTLVACLVSATLATPLVLLRAPESQALAIWTTWFMAHVLGMVVMATLVVCTSQPQVRLAGRRGHRADYFVSIGLLVLSCWVTFAQTTYPLLFLNFLPLLLLSYRHGVEGMIVGTLVLAVSSGLAASLDLGPFALMHGSSPLAQILFWQFYVACGCLFAYTTTVALAERRRLEAKVRRSETRLLAITENLPAMVARFDRQVVYTYANAQSRAARPGVELVGHALREVRGVENFEAIRPQVEAVLRGEAQDFEAVTNVAGAMRTLHVQFVPDIGPDGRVQGFYSLSLDISEAKAAKQELERLARYDALTGLANRRYFDERVAAAVNRASRTGAPLMVLSLDLDRFKSINDSYGHATGDEVLREFAARLGASVFDVDVVGRLGGDEFVVLVEYKPTATVGVQIARRMLDAMREPMQVGGRSLKVSTSIGIGLHQPVTSPQRLMALADEALYDAKSRGRDTWALREG